MEEGSGNLDSCFLGEEELVALTLESEGGGAPDFCFLPKTTARNQDSGILREAGLGRRAGDGSLTVSVPQTPLHLAVITTLPSVVRLLVMAGASPMALDRHGQTAAHLACEHRSPACLRALLDSAAGGTMDLEARNYDGGHLPGRGVGLSSRTWSPSEAAKPQAQV